MTGYHSNPPLQDRADASGNGRGLPPRLLAKLRVEIEGYELLERLGEGGQATVYKAIQKADERLVAIKVLHAGPHADDQAQARMWREIKALRAIRHPNIVRAIGAGRTRSGLHCLVMNFIDGKRLDTLWNLPADETDNAPDTLDLAERLRLFHTICQTVQAAHRRGITHRDLSPSNILIDPQGRPHILDFGMASTAFDRLDGPSLTLTGHFIGKLQYASPEQARSAGSESTSVDIRSDVYALGVMLYQLLTHGAYPYEVVGNVIDVLHNIIHTTPKRPSEVLHARDLLSHDADQGTLRRNPPLVNETIEAIILKALEKDPAHRYQSAGELAADIEHYLAGRPTAASAWAQNRKPRHARTSTPHRRTAIVAVTTLAVLTITGVAMNAKTLALWLGLTTAAMPMLPAESTPFSPSAADAATLAAQQAEGSERRLNDLAADLAKIDARLHAVHKQIAATTSRIPPELDERDPGASGPFPAEEYIAVLAKSATETGRPIAFEPLLQLDRDRAEQAEANAIERETDPAALLSRRATLDEEQAKAWARLSWGVFIGREADRLYRFNLTVDPAADAGTTYQARVLEAGVRVRRLAAAAMDAAATTLRVPEPQPEGQPVPDLGTVAAGLAEQLRADLATFQKAASTARDSGGLNSEDEAAVAELQRHAARLRDALEGAAEMYARAARADDELARFTARDRLQRDLRDTLDAAVRLDAGLVKAAADWSFQVNPDSPMREVQLVDAGTDHNRRSEPATPEVRVTQREAATNMRDVFPVESEWSGTVSTRFGISDARAVVTSARGSTATLRVDRGGNTYNLVLTASGDRITVARHEGVFLRGAPRPSVFSNIDIQGTIQEGVLNLSGSWTRTPHGEQGTVDPDVRFTLRMVMDPRTIDPLAAWEAGSRWSTINRGGGPSIWTVRSRNDNEMEIQRDSVSHGTVVVTLKITGSRVTVIRVRHADGNNAMNRDWRGVGTIGPNSLRLTYSVESSGGGKPWSRWEESINLKPE